MGRRRSRKRGARARAKERLREYRQTDGFGSSVKMLLDLAEKLQAVGSSVTMMQDLAENLCANEFGSDGMMLLDLAEKLQADGIGSYGMMLLDLAEKLQADGIGSSEKKVLDLAEKLQADGIGSSEKKVLDLAEKLQADGSGSSEKKVIDLAEKLQADGIESSEKMALDLADDVYTGKELEALKDEWLDKSLGFPAPWESVYSAGMDDTSQWPPIWKEKIEDCPEYESLAHFLSDPECTNPSDWITKIILQQILDSRGYDITLPCCGFMPLNLEYHLELFIATRVCRYATDQINERAQEHDELYVFNEVKKIVERVEAPSPLRKCFYTFTVKEARAFENIKTVQAYIHFASLDKLLVCVKGWRFKP